MFLTAVILILFFSLSDLAKWMNQNGATDKEKFFVVGGIFLLILVIIKCLQYGLKLMMNLSFIVSNQGYLCPERVYKSGKTVYAGLFRYRVQK